MRASRGCRHTVTSNADVNMCSNANAEESRRRGSEKRTRVGRELIDD